MAAVEQATDMDFIGAWDDGVDPALCAAIIERFERSGQATRGSVGSGVKTELKDSWDICLDQSPGWGDVVEALNTAMLGCMLRYVRKYPYTLLAPMTLQMKSPDGGKPVTLTADHVREMEHQRLVRLVTKVFRPGAINVQKYIADEGGYPYWHCELYPKNDGGETLHRVLLWCTYLNEGFEGGETEFFYQQRKVVPKTGRLVIAPSTFTHTHRGNKPLGGNKYLATSWILFQRAEQLYAPG